MTDEEAYVVAKIVSDAHEGCWGCSRKLISHLLAAFPACSESIIQAFRDQFGTDYLPP